MKIVHIITRLIVGGAQENTLLTCRGLVEKGHDVVLLTGPETGPEGSMFDVAGAYGVKVEIVAQLCRDVHPLKDAIALVQLTKALRRLRPEVVHTHSSKAGILGRLAGRWTGTKAVVHTIHGLPFFRGQNRLVNRAYILTERLTAGWSDKLVAVADDMIYQACQARVAPREKFVTIYSGLEGEAFGPRPGQREVVRREQGIPTETFVIVMIARLAPLKGHEYLLEALGELMPKHRQIWCVLVGDGKLRQWIQDYLKRCGLADRVRLTGLLPPGEIPRILSAADLLVHTSVHEGLPRAVVQGLLGGLPVVAFNQDGAREVLTPGKTGYLISPGSVEELTKAIEDIVTGQSPVRGPDHQQRAELARRFGWQGMAAKLEKLYYDLLE